MVAPLESVTTPEMDPVIDWPEHTPAKSAAKTNADNEWIFINFPLCSEYIDFPQPWLAFYRQPSTGSIRQERCKHAFAFPSPTRILNALTNCFDNSMPLGKDRREILYV